MRPQAEALCNYGLGLFSAFLSRFVIFIFVLLPVVDEQAFVVRVQFATHLKIVQQLIDA